MVGISITLLTTTISTIIVVTMATLFFCCWRKKGSRDIVAGKSSKNGSTKEDVKKDRSGSLTPSAVGRSENGALTENQSATNGEMKLPLLSLTACPDSNDDLGDFSAVQRETEILRSYRKPPPPKHRARQTRAPRHLKNGNESSDIFTELSEEDAKNENISDKENIASYDDADNSVLRSHSEDKTKSPREARSSMLADIEQTLAALHMSDQSEVVQMVDSSSPEHKTDTTEAVPEVNECNHGEKTVCDTKPELYAGDFEVSENTVCSTSQTLISGEIKSEPGPINLASSPTVNHTVKPKTGPKVSPKPSPKASARVRSGDDSISTNTAVDKHRDIHESDSVSVSSSSADNGSSLDPAAISFQHALSQEESDTTDIGAPGETSSCLQTILKSTDETATNVTEAEKPLDSTGSDILSILTDTITMSREDIIPESVMNGSNKDKPETIPTSEVTKSWENSVTDKTNDEDTITEIGRSITTKSAHESTEADFASQEQSESVTLVSDSKEKINPPDDATEVNEAVPPSTAQAVKPILVDEAIEQNTQQQVTETAVVEQGGGSDGSPREDGKQQKESNEDQTGKGKISKIPVRSGAKYK